MKLFKVGKKCKDKDFNLVCGGWNVYKIGQGFIFHVIISAHYTFLVKIKEVKCALTQIWKSPYMFVFTWT